MKIMIVGSGGREHAIAWKVAQSPRTPQLYIAPGNAGTAQLGRNVPLSTTDVPALVRFTQDQGIELVIVGPEAALEAGLVDALAAAGIRAFGPTRSAARIETSKAFSKAFMQRHNIPTAQYAAFNRYHDALAYIEQASGPVVIKSSGLAAGKGVFLPETLEDARTALKQMMVEHIFGMAGEHVIIEERLAGEEVSLLAFTDGVTVRPMLPAQDHKRLMDGDLGPNTGGMGAYAPAPVCPPALVEEIVQTVLQPAVNGMRSEGYPFQGVLYAGMILTGQGLRVLEFNCRFGDPETQVLLPLLETDLLDIVEACVDGRLEQITPQWNSGSAATVVMASAGYPVKTTRGQLIKGLDSVGAGETQAWVFHAGTREENDQVFTDGGRVLNVTGLGLSLEEALSRAYQRVQAIHFPGAQYRSDIGARAIKASSREVASAYTASGVNIDAGNRAVSLMREDVRSTYSPAVLAGIGAFGGLFDVSSLLAMRNPVLVASTDGVGTKVRLAAQLGRYDMVGQDIVNHCIDDILVQGAKPLFFLDYFATSALDPQVVAQIVHGIANACRSANCALLGGETAEMPGVYCPGEFDVAGTIVGVAERERLLPKDTLNPGDVLVGLSSSGPHTNGYSLIRKVFARHDLNAFVPELGCTLADALLVPHRSYLRVLEEALSLTPSPIKALAHLTGGGFIENIPRILPDQLRAVVYTKNWAVPPLFSLIQSLGQVDPSEMYRVFNMGIGMVAIVAPDRLVEFQSSVKEPTVVIGELVAGEKGVDLR